MENMDDYEVIIGNSVADKDIEIISEKLNKLHISEQTDSDAPDPKKVKRLRDMKKYRETNKEKIKEKRKRREEVQPEIRQKRLKQNRVRYYKKKYGMTEEECKFV